jgi:predicted transcriptional regulator of viral defense system
MNYSKLKGIKKVYFGCEEISKSLGITSESARVTANRYFRQGVLLRIKRNLYILKDRWEALTREGKFGMANLAQVPSYVSLMSALDYYEITTQVQRDFIESVAVKRTKAIDVSGTVLNFTKINSSLYFGFVREKNFFIATPEKAFLDAAYLMSFNRYNFDLSSIDRGKLDVAKIKAMAEKFPKKTREVLKRYGYIAKA